MACATAGPYASEFQEMLNEACARADDSSVDPFRLHAETPALLQAKAPVRRQLFGRGASTQQVKELYRSCYSKAERAVDSEWDKAWVHHCRLEVYKTRFKVQRGRCFASKSTPGQLHGSAFVVDVLVRTTTP